MKRLAGKRIKTKLKSFVRPLVTEYGFVASYETSKRGVPYVRVYVNNERYHICFFGKHQFYRVFHASHPDNPHVDFPLAEEEAMFEYLTELKGGFHGHERDRFVTTHNPIHLVERNTS